MMGADAAASGSYLTSTRGKRVVLCLRRSRTAHNDAPVCHGLITVAEMPSEGGHDDIPISKGPKLTPGFRSTSNFECICAGISCHTIKESDTRGMVR